MQLMTPSKMGLAKRNPARPRVQANNSSRSQPFGVYVHVPFCARSCDFCAFYQVEPRRSDIDLYLETIEREFALVNPPSACDTAFWGGGTPGLLPARDLERLGRAQIDHLGVPLREWSVELAPGSVKSDKLSVLKDLGVNRVSLGVQSFSPRLLDALGRQHSLDQVNRAWELIEKAGFQSRNLDLMFALPGQSLDEWRADLREAVARGADHVSTYCLTFEEDTALFVKLSAGKVSIDIERDRAFYEETWRVMGESGFEQYEISNYARPGHICIHNQHTWRMHQWAGVGPSAAGQERGWRSANPPDLLQWARQIGEGIRGTVDRVQLSDEQLAEDCLIFGLRMNEGIVLEELESRFSKRILAPHRATLERLTKEGLLAVRETSPVRHALTDAGRLVADAVGVEFLRDSIESG